MHKQHKKIPTWEPRASNLVHGKGLRITGLLFLIALGIELLYLRSYSVNYVLSPDGLLYSNIAENFLRGHGLMNTLNFIQGDDGLIRVAQPRDYVVGPIYPLLLALVYGIFGFKSYGIVILLHAVLGAASATLAYKTGELLFGKVYAWIPYGLTLGYPLFAFWGRYILTETIYVFTITLFLYLSARYAQEVKQSEVKQPKIRILVVLGAAIGISNLVRPMLLLYFPVLGFWILWMCQWRWKTALRDFSLIVVMTILIMSPWWIRNAVKYHQFISVSNYGSYEFYVGNNSWTVSDSFFYFRQPGYEPEVKARIEKLPILEQEKEYKRVAEAYILKHPVQFLKRTLVKEVNLFWQPISSAAGKLFKMQGYALDKWYLILGAFGMLISLFYLKKYSFLWLFTGYYSFIVSMITVIEGARYRLPVMPAMILFGSLVVVSVLQGIGRLSRANRRTGGTN